jgi:hypothetical protein
MKHRIGDRVVVHRKWHGTVVGSAKVLGGETVTVEIDGTRQVCVYDVACVEGRAMPNESAAAEEKP